MIYTRLASAIYNDVVAGLRGYSSVPSLSLEQLEDDIIDERLKIIKEFTLNGIIPRKDLMLSIRCVKVDCQSLDRCCVTSDNDQPIAHFEIPQILVDYGIDSIDYIGATDMKLPFIWYTNVNTWNSHKYRKRGKKKPYVFIDVTPNGNNMYDGYIFNAPMIKQLTITAIFKDPRQLADYNCCNNEDIDNFSFVHNEIKRRLTEKKLRYYRQFAPSPVINDQVAR